jgi:hypothetical protein
MLFGMLFFILSGILFIYLAFYVTIVVNQKTYFPLISNSSTQSKPWFSIRFVHETGRVT